MMQVFDGAALGPPPIWLMRQAGRYLPEYREVRAKAGSFLNLCYNPAMAAEVTLQPIRRYGFDAAILFSDILVVPDALGQNVRFVEGEGPRLDPIRDAAGLANLSLRKATTKFDTVAETVQRLRQGLPGETALIGFCGAPWTVATYMVGGQGSSDQAAARGLAYRDPTLFQSLMDLLVDASVDYLGRQARAGADLLQIFDSWAGSLPDDEFETWVVAPTRRIVAQMKAQFPDLPIIGFPRGSGPLAFNYVQETGVDAVGCDTAMPLELIRSSLSGKTVVQGNLDPLLLVAGGDRMRRRIDTLLATLAANPYIFNLGHGIVPETPPEHVAELVRHVRSYGRA
ncbi:MAG: uroporphyrinogen decarboxylase [Hyphomicrobiaceae bacterium]|nr:uroporphyrinogen decarboxylase [Hyphomicrobiaceae bacterium]